MTTINDLPELALSKNGSIQRTGDEVELKRCSGVACGSDGSVDLTLTNKRLIVRCTEAADNTTRVLSLGQVQKSKTASGRFSMKKQPKMTLKVRVNGEDAKYELTFSKPPLSIYSANEERDEFCRLIATHAALVDDEDAAAL